MCQPVKHGSHSFLGISILWFKKLLHEPFVKHGSDDIVHYLRERRNFIFRTMQNIEICLIYLEWFFWDDPYQDQRFKITLIMVHRKNWSILSPQGIQQFLWCILIWVIFHHWSWSRSSQPKKHAPNTTTTTTKTIFTLTIQVPRKVRNKKETIENKMIEIIWLYIQFESVNNSLTTPKTKHSDYLQV